MNKVFNINLGGQPLTIDEDAYRLLENYLQSLHNHFRQSEGYEEIMSDIEARLGELIREGMGKRAIVMIQDVKNTVSIMGKPEEFGAEPMDETQKATETAQSTQNTDSSRQNREGGQNASKSAKKTPIQTGKRLFRDEENKVVGGVCSGLAAYFGIEEVVWVRLGVFALGIFTGLGFFLYLILWIIIPAAKTTADRLAMRGEPIDVNSIAKSIETGFEDLSKKVNEFGQDKAAHARFGQQFSDGINAVGVGIGSVLKNLGGVAKFLAAMISIVIIVGIVISWIAAAVGLAWAAPIAGYLTDESWEASLSLVTGFILIAVPTLALVFFVRRLLFKRGVHDAVHFVMWTIWAINCTGIAYLAANFGKNFTHSVDKTQTYNLSSVVDTFNIAVIENSKNNINVQFGSLRVSEEFLLSEDVTLFIQPSTGTEFELTQKSQAQGRTTEEAQTLLSRMNYTPSVSGNKLTVPAEFLIPKGSKWRGQVVDMTLKIPIGKIFRMTEAEIDSWRVIRIDKAEGKRRHNCYGDRIQTWRMTENGAVCINEEKNKKRKTVKEDEEEEDDEDDE
jgi:phage shock protein PspC (stress-responsive transcriptional regulator)